MITKIAMTGDSERPVPGQSGNIRWLYELLRSQIELSTGIAPVKVESGVILELADWLRTYRNTFDWNAERCWLQKTYMESHPSEWLVVGFEMSTMMKRWMEKKGIVYVDMIVHPIRFLDDLVMGMVCGGIENPKPSIGQETFKAHAGLVRSQMYRLKPLGIRPDTALVIGQTEVDRSVVSDGRVLSLAYFEDRLNAVKAKYKNILFKPHPHNKTGPANQLMERLGAQLIDENVYRMFSDDNLRHVCGISSSCLYEARYFGKETEFFGNGWADNYVPVTPENFLSINFWSRLLKSVATTKEVETDVWFAQGMSRIRRSCGSWWGFDFVDGHK